MSTGAVIARKSAPDSGKLCYWDGYPTWLGKSICELIRRDGVDEALTMLVDESFGWSSIDPAEGDVIEHPDIYDEDHFFAAPGYGIAYTAKQAKPLDVWKQGRSEFWGYLVSDDGEIEVFCYGKPYGFVNAFSDTYAEEMAAIEHEVYGD